MGALFDEIQAGASEEKSKIGAIRSTLAGIGSGIFKIPEGVFSLGASLIDLGADTNTAASVEEFFAKINPFDEAAEATTAGKIAELIVNIGVPGGIAFKAGNNLAKVAIAGKKAGRYLDPAQDLSKLSKADRLTKFDELATMKDKIKAFGTGAGFGGVAEAAFVADVEDAGTFGDLIGGPTEIDRSSGTAEAELLNRLKFGIEGTAFTGLLGGVGLGIKKLRSQVNNNKAIKGQFNKWIDKNIAGPLRSRGDKPSDIADAIRTKEGAQAADRNVVDTVAQGLDGKVDNIFPFFKRLFADKATDAERNTVVTKMNDVIFSSDIKPIAGETADSFARRRELYKKTGKHKKLNPTFSFVDEIAKDDTTGFLFEPGKGLLKNYKEKTLPANSLGTLKTIDPITKKEITVNTKTGKKIFNADVGKVNEDVAKEFQEFALKKHKVEFKDSALMIDKLNEVRGLWTSLYTKMGRRLSPESQKEFQELMSKYINNWMESGYKAFQPSRNDPFRLLNNYKPTKELINKIGNNFMEVAERKGVKIGKLEADKYANDIVGTARLPYAYKLKSTIDFEGPAFLKDSFLGTKIKDPALRTLRGKESGVIKIDEITGINKKLVQELLGKSDSVMPTILESTNKLSAIVRYNEMNDFIKNLSDKQMKVIKDEIETLTKPVREGGQGMAPEVAKRMAIQNNKSPLTFATKEEAMEFTGAAPNEVSMFGEKITKRGVQGTEASKVGKETVPLDRFRDPDFELGSFSYLDKKGKVQVAPIINALDGRYALNETLRGIGNVQKSFLGDDFASQLYQNLVLYPKATSQMAKTILAPFTHARNFMSAAAFAAANGLIPLGDTEAVKQAKNAIQIFGRTKDGNQLYQKLLNLGVVNSQVQLGDLTRLLDDVGFGSSLGEVRAFKGLMKKLGQAKRFAEDAYTAEDDFWKIFTWFGEKGRIAKNMDNAGMVRGKKYKDIDGNEFTYNDNWIEGEAANIVKNQVPNYAFVSDFVKSLRQLPLGNFIAFPAEILRTGTNIVERGLKEYNYSIPMVKNGKTVNVNPLRTIGLTRLTGFLTTTTAVPYAAVEAGKALYNVSEDELQAMRRYVAEWSKNSTLIPLRDDKGKLEYIDFSHMNAYDTLTRPIQTVLNAVQSGRVDNDGIMDDFMLGIAESGKELASPFISESIWTEAISDIVIRKGRTKEGRPIYNPEEKTGNKMFRILDHLIESQMPLNWKQMQRLGLSMFPADSKGRFDERGNEYEFGNEALGILGMRSVKVDPAKGINYKITDYKKGIRNSRNIFTSRVAKGGPITPEEIVDAYILANEALYRVNRNMYQDIKAAKILGTDEDTIQQRMSKRGERRAFNSLIEGEFRPLSISTDLKQLFEASFSELGLPNAFDQAEDAIQTIRDILRGTPVSFDGFPNLPNPFRQSIIPNLGSTPVGQLPPIITGADTNVVAQNARFGSVPFTSLPEDKQLEEFNKVFPNG